MVKETELYDALEVPPTASKSDIKKSYFRLAKLYHPDKNPGKEEEFKKVQSAYEVLSDDEKRASYDRYGIDGVRGSEPTTGFDPFSMFFQGGFGGSRSQKKTVQKYQELDVPINLSLEDLYRGLTTNQTVERSVECKECSGTGSIGPNGICKCQQCNGQGVVIATSRMGNCITQRQMTCPKCNGAGETIGDPNDVCKSCNGKKYTTAKKSFEVTVDSGMADNMEIKFAEEGSWAPGYKVGDLIFVVKQKPHPVYRREGADLFMEKTISVEEALCGFSFDIQHLSGETVRIFQKTPLLKEGITMCCDNLGMPIYGKSYEHGRLFIKISVKYPDNISDDVKSAIIQLLSTKVTKKRIEDAAKAKHDGVKVFQMKNVDPNKVPRTPAAVENTSNNAYDYNGNESAEEQGGMQCQPM